MGTPSVPGVDRDALAAAIRENIALSNRTAELAADAALAHIAAHHECACTCCGAKYDKCPECAADDAYEKGRKDAACDREHADDEWVEVDEVVWLDLPDDARRRMEWAAGLPRGGRLSVHRDDLPDPDAAKVERMAKAIFASVFSNSKWEGWSESLQGTYRKAARAALAASREEERSGNER